MTPSSSHRLSSVDDCVIIDLHTERNANGNLSVAENIDTAPFTIRRAYYIYDVPAGAERGGHSHFEQVSLMVALSGSFDVVIDDGVKTRRVTLNRPDRGLLITRGIWRMVDNFSSGAICLVLASTKYSEDDYVRDYESFKYLTSKKIKI